MNPLILPTYRDVELAADRIDGQIHNTPILSSSLLNQWLGHKVYFKAECLQRVGAFKARGGLNAIKWLAEQGELPKRIVANSSGNHAQAVAWAAAQMGIPATIYMPANASKVKVQATRFYGAEVVLCDDREEVDRQVEEAAGEPGVFWLPPYNHPQIIAGQGTAVKEALETLGDIDAVFAPCGGGGLLSGSLLSTRVLAPNAQVIGVEPLGANDAAESLRSGKIERLEQMPTTIADGARTPSVGNFTFPLIQQTDGFYEIDEPEIVYWTQWLQHLLKLHIEPTSCMTMEAVVQWLRLQAKPCRVLVVLSGGNIDQVMMKRIWEIDQLDRLPSL